MDGLVIYVITQPVVRLVRMDFVSILIHVSVKIFGMGFTATSRNVLEIVITDIATLIMIVHAGQVGVEMNATMRHVFHPVKMENVYIQGFVIVSEGGSVNFVTHRTANHNATMEHATKVSNVNVLTDGKEFNATTRHVSQNV